MPMTYASLIATKSTPGSIRNWVNRDTTDPETVLTEAQDAIYRILRHWRMKAEAVGDLVIGDDFLPLPDDFIQPRDLWLTGFYKRRLLKGDERLTQQRYAYDDLEARVLDIPKYYYLSGENVKFDNPPDKPYHYLLDYWRRPAELSDINQTNFLTTEAPRLLRTACMLIAVEFEKEVGQGGFDRTYWQQEFMGQLQNYQIASDMADFARDAYPEFA